MNAILACDPKGGIGVNNKLPWDKLQDDLARFKKLTENGVIVMGRSTWESLPKKPLVNRLNIVVSNRELSLPNGAMRTDNINHFKHYSNVWLIGGARLLESCWELIDTLHLSRTYTHYDCDTFIDLLKLQREFSQISCETFVDHTYEIWGRR